MSKKRKVPAAKNGTNSDEESIPTKKARFIPEAPKQRKRKPAGTVKVARPIGRSYEECEECDKMLINMRQAGKEWPEIREEWEKLTGEETGSSTLPNRYQRLLNNFTVIPDQDKAILIAAKQTVEREFEKEKWAKIANEMQKNNTALYKPDVLERQHKKMMLEAESLSPVGMITKSGSKAPPKSNDESILSDDDE